MFKKLLFAAGALVVLTYTQETEVAAVSETTESVETTEVVETTTEVVTTEEAPVEEVPVEEAPTEEEVIVVVQEEAPVIAAEEGFTASGTISGSGSATGSVTVTDLEINGASTIVVPTAALVALAALLH